MKELIIRPIAVIHTDFKEKFGIPRQSGRAPSAEGTVVFEPEFRVPEALKEIEGFSHLWLIFDFSEAHREEWSPTVRPPRLGGNRRVGVFASRSPFRPNPLGLSCVKLLRVEHTPDRGEVLIVSGCDLLDGTPIFDIKPYLPTADIRADAVGGYADAPASYRLEVVFPEELLENIPADKRAALLESLADDPRPSYQNDPERVYSMRYGSFDVRFTVDNGILRVTETEQKE